MIRRGHVNVVICIFMLHSITLTLCLRYTEVDQTFGWARLAMGLKYIPCHWVGVIVQGMVK